jgi:hypothetical protein
METVSHLINAGMSTKVLPYHRHTGVRRYDKISTIYISLNQLLDRRQVECDVIDEKSIDRISIFFVPIYAVLQKNLKWPTLQMSCLLNSQMNACEQSPKTTSSDFNR